MQKVMPLLAGLGTGLKVAGGALKGVLQRARAKRKEKRAARKAAQAAELEARATQTLGAVAQKVGVMPAMQQALSNVQGVMEAKFEEPAQKQKFNPMLVVGGVLVLVLILVFVFTKK